MTEPAPSGGPSPLRVGGLALLGAGAVAAADRAGHAPPRWRRRHRPRRHHRALRRPRRAPAATSATRGGADGRTRPRPTAIAAPAAPPGGSGQSGAASNPAPVSPAPPDPAPGRTIPRRSIPRRSIPAAGGGKEPCGRARARPRLQQQHDHRSRRPRRRRLPRQRLAGLRRWPTTRPGSSRRARSTTGPAPRSSRRPRRSASAFGLRVEPRFTGYRRRRARPHRDRHERLPEAEVALAFA